MWDLLHVVTVCSLFVEIITKTSRNNKRPSSGLWAEFSLGSTMLLIVRWCRKPPALKRWDVNLSAEAS
jgi:hypothetical protein